MNSIKATILHKICYTELVYGRINKKLNLQLSEADIELLIFNCIQETPDANFQRIGKNIYVTHIAKQIRITINSYTYRVITVDDLRKRLKA